VYFIANVTGEGRIQPLPGKEFNTLAGAFRASMLLKYNGLPLIW
jgi:hypothetical protein